MKKYELTTNTIEVNGVTLYQIRALRDFRDVKEGDLGGYVQSEDNLSHDGNCWIYHNARVYGNAEVFGNSRVYDNAWVFGNAWIHGNTCVYGNAKIK